VQGAPKSAFGHEQHRPIDPNDLDGCYPRALTKEIPMAIKAQKTRAKLHRLRDNVHRAKRDVKRGLPGAEARLKAHAAVRQAFAQTCK
jgi:hypothetical protein